VQLLPNVPVLPPPPLLVQVTVPLGVLALPADVSVTVAVHVVGWFSPVGLGKQVTVVPVARFEMLKVLLVAPVRPALDAARV
jgi:hypothetical protein